MINYELAKKLKDAGFPQIAGACWVLLKERRIQNQKTGEWYVRPEKWVKHPHIVFPGKGLEKALDWAIIPNLSELIEACGDSFFVFTKELKEQHWYAKAWKDLEGDNADEIPTHGATPEEAVANLWLALNPQVNN